MPQVDEPVCAAAFPAVRDVGKMRSPPRTHSGMRVVPERVAQLGRLAHMSRVVTLGQPAASIGHEISQTRSTTVGSLAKCRGRHW